YTAREPLVILVLVAITVGFIFVVSELSSFYKTELSDRAAGWSSRGQDDLRTGKFVQAVADFQTALTYSRGNYSYELSLAQALGALKRKEEARAYLISLWQRQPENGSVNLELARIYAEKDDVTNALRYYHNAIYAVWNTNPEAQQLSVRLELVNFLIDHKANNLAESELIAVGRNLPQDAQLQIRIGDLFMRVPDYQRALQIYRQALKLERHNSDALTRAGRAAFESGEYQLAERYLTSASALKANDPEITGLLKMCRTIPNLDPYNFYSAVRRDRTVLNDFNTAGERLTACINSTASNSNGNSPLQPLYTQWMDMKTQVTERNLREHPELIDPAMNLVFNTERETSNLCGNPAGHDLLLLLIARNHEGS
ncbi:MAG TPA: tetratricopeptide repeat protein, partial [Candidatus Binataceae bacterium]|nr:tetratricopeptide repeat protein [Candidatus Binataceae bacterium]